LTARKAATQPRGKTTAERVVFALSLIVVATVVAGVLWLWTRGEQEPPRLRVEVGSAAPQADGFRLPFEVVNDGGRTAARVTVEGTLGEGPSAEQSLTVFDYVPGRSRERGVLVFRSDPRQARVRVTSYQEP
jgi:uncharacterized protein (TIGR02588 family)